MFLNVSSLDSRAMTIVALFITIGRHLSGVVVHNRKRLKKTGQNLMWPKFFSNIWCCRRLFWDTILSTMLPTCFCQIAAFLFKNLFEWYQIFWRCLFLAKFFQRFLIVSHHHVKLLTNSDEKINERRCLAFKERNFKNHLLPNNKTLYWSS